MGLPREYSRKRRQLAARPRLLAKSLRIIWNGLYAGRDGAVYLDLDRPRVCVRGSEDRESRDLGYEWLRPNEVFSFFELSSVSPGPLIGSTQLDTLRDAGIVVEVDERGHRDGSHVLAVEVV